MTTGKLTIYWTLIIILLIAVITVGGTVVWAKYSPSRPVEISILPTEELQGDIISGALSVTPVSIPLPARIVWKLLFKLVAELPAVPTSAVLNSTSPKPEGKSNHKK